MTSYFLTKSPPSLVCGPFRGGQSLDSPTRRLYEYIMPCRQMQALPKNKKHLPLYVAAPSVRHTVVINDTAQPSINTAKAAVDHMQVNLIGSALHVLFQLAFHALQGIIH